MKKKFLFLSVMCCFFFGSFTLLQAQKTTVGAHVKLTLYDRPSGDHNNLSGSSYVGIGFREMILYLSQELTDKISVDLQPMFSASTGATPVFGKNIGEQKTAAGDVDGSFGGWVKAVVKAVLPGGYELSVGIVKPRFTWDYGAELFWQDEFNGGKFSCNSYLGAMHDTGFELYKNFEIGSASLPVYLYVLNGGYEFSDNNNSPMGMIHVEPEFGPVKLLGSLAIGKYDDASKNSVTRYAFGASYTKGPFTLRSEYAAGNWKKSIGGMEDAKPKGYYVKAFYRFASWGRAMLHYDYVDNNYAGFFYTAPGHEKYRTITPGFQLYASESSIILIQYDIVDWTQTGKFGVPGQEDKLKFKRLTVGWRTTF